MVRAAADMALFGFVRRFGSPDLDQRAHLVNALCKHSTMLQGRSVKRLWCLRSIARR